MNFIIQNSIYSKILIHQILLELPEVVESLIENKTGCQFYSSINLFIYLRQVANLKRGDHFGLFLHHSEYVDVDQGHQDERCQHEAKETENNNV